MCFIQNVWSVDTISLLVELRSVQYDRWQMGIILLIGCSSTSLCEYNARIVHDRVYLYEIN